MRRFVIIAVIAASVRTTEAYALEANSPDLVAALSSDASASNAAIARLRNRGREAFDELLALRDRVTKNAGEAKGIDPARLEDVIDRVGGARYSTASRLFWHTDLEAAKAAAKKSGRPILSLRMMGYLTDEFSCANSRFFRTTLYANADISAFLRQHYVLHWKSVRPVPKVTIDFGDGRKLERTLTGNSIHYVLAPDGRVIDGLPGLYAPGRFLAWVKSLHKVGTALENFKGGPQALAEGLKSWHAVQASEILRKWKADLVKVAISKSVAQRSTGTDDSAKNRKDGEPPTAKRAARVTVPKSLVELRVIANVMMESKQLERQTNEDVWNKIAALYAKDAKLDKSSVRLIGRENPTAAQASKLTRGKGKVEDPLLRMIGKFESSIAMDTVRNEYLLHSKLHEWLSKSAAPADVEQLNERVYAELFLTPSSDPWIGLVPRDVYTGLDNAGVSAERSGIAHNK